MVQKTQRPLTCFLLFFFFSFMSTLHEFPVAAEVEAATGEDHISLLTENSEYTNDSHCVLCNQL